MKGLIVRASAPSNIALIKYMGKSQSASNLPSNSSLSYTLEHLRTFVELEETTSSNIWKPLQNEANENLKLYPLTLSESGQSRFLNHLERLKKHFHVSSSFVVRSANNFPSDCGLASSASSFAALTLSFFEYMKLKNPSVDITLEELSHLSRQASGSSCRSFFSPWSLWRDEQAQSLDLPVKELFHQAVIVESDQKSVSSSEAHQRVLTSLLFEGRSLRAEKRLQALLKVFQDKDWSQAFEICWAEFWDMHALFESAQPSFGYMTEGSLWVLEQVRDVWRQKKVGPLVTMDAGANVHLLYQRDQRELAWELEKLWKSRFSVFSNLNHLNDKGE